MLKEKGHAGWWEAHVGDSKGKDVGVLGSFYVEVSERHWWMNGRSGAIFICVYMYMYMYLVMYSTESV